MTDTPGVDTDRKSREVVSKIGNRSQDGVWLIFRPKYATLEENEAAENVPDPVTLRENYVHPVNGYPNRG